MPIIGGDNGVSKGGYDNGVATLKYCNSALCKKKDVIVIINLTYVVLQ